MTPEEEKIESMMLGYFRKHRIEDIPEHRLPFLVGVQETLNEMPFSMEQLDYRLTVNRMILHLKMQINFARFT